MATRSTIALEYADGTVDQIYCHWDGYLAHNGAILNEHYQDPFRVQQLMDLGDLSSLAAEVDAGADSHSFDSPKEGVCVFYGRDRGETGTNARRFKSFEDYRDRAQSEEYNYILRMDGQWRVAFYGEFDGLLTEALERESALAAA